MKTDPSSITPPNPIFKYLPTTTSIGLRFAGIIFGLILLVVVLSRLTWTLGQWGQKQDLQRLTTTLNTISYSVYSSSGTATASEPLGAPGSASYVVVGANDTLQNERILQA